MAFVFGVVIGAVAMYFGKSYVDKLFVKAEM